MAVHGRRRFPASGLAWRADQVVTAAHVLERDTDLSITAPDGTPARRRLVGRDPGSDLAVLAVPGAALQPIDARPRTRWPPATWCWPSADRAPPSRSPASAPSARSAAPGARPRAACSTPTSAPTSRCCPGCRAARWPTCSGRVVGMLSALLAGGDPVAIPVDSIDAIVQRILSGGSAAPRLLGVSTQPVELQESLRAAAGHRADGGPDAARRRAGRARPSAAACSPATSCWPSAVARSRTAKRCRWRSGPDAVGRPTPIKLIRGGELREITRDARRAAELMERTSHDCSSST